jgi:ribosomal protein L3
MAGRMGGDNVKVQNRVLKVVADKNHLLLKDVFPGH